MRERGSLAIAGCLAFAALDLAVKAVVSTPPGDVHQRSGAWFVLSAALLAGSALLVWIPSRAIAMGSALLAGGVLGNLVSASLMDGGVPNPILIGDHVDGIAFNLADVFVLAGILVLVPALIAATFRYRHLLPQSTVIVRAVRRLRS
jgi:Signal peptidase (SPase) II